MKAHFVEDDVLALKSNPKCICGHHELEHGLFSNPENPHTMCSKCACTEFEEDILE